jgi:hypothetical protein
MSSRGTITHQRIPLPSMLWTPNISWPLKKSPPQLTPRTCKDSSFGKTQRPSLPPAPHYPGVMLSLPEGLLDKPTSIAEKPEKKTRSPTKLYTPVGPYLSQPKTKEMWKKHAGKTPGQLQKKVSYTLTLRTNRRYSRRYSTSTIWGH